MNVLEISEPILVNKSIADSRSPIMPHQQDAIDSMTEYFQLDKDLLKRNGLVVMPTGSGKTYTAVNWLLSQGVAKGYRVVWLVHRQELVEQTYNEFRNQTPILKGTGVDKIRILPISSAHLKMVAANKADVYVCSVASVANKYGYRFIERMIGAAGRRKLIIVVDEAHHAVAANYQKVISRMTKLNPNRILLGLTATPKRMQESEQKILQEMFSVNENLIAKRGQHGYVYEVTLKQLLMSGFLAEPVYEKVNTEINGEIEYKCTPEDEMFFMQFGELSEKLKRQIALSSVRNKLIVKQYVNNKEKYGKTLVFAVNQLHAETLCQEFNKADISCDFAVSDRLDAQEVIKKFKNNAFQVLINVQILTEGSDVPDIQTVFLTRQTNSDSLLMQMIGRGLRGEKAGGTKVANIVSFNDDWGTFAHWLDPGALDIFKPEKIKVPKPLEVEIEIEKPKIEPNDELTQMIEKLGGTADTISGELNPQEIRRLTRELYFKLYEIMRASLISENEIAVYPYGWYSVIDENGDDYSVLVFDNQLEAYKNIETNIRVIKNRLTVSGLKKFYFNQCDKIPNDEELYLILDFINETDAMPPFYTFEQRGAMDPFAIAEKVNSLFSKDADKEEWLKKLYDNAPILQQIYKYFFAFKKTVFDTMNKKIEAVIESEDERQEYSFEDNYYNLYDLLDEIKVQYPKLATDGLVKLAWSNNVVKSWYGLCQRFVVDDHNVFQIHINKILSSPLVDKEVIKYLIFHELLHENGYWDHDEAFRDREWQYPNSAELDGFLDTMALQYNLEDAFKNAVYYETPELEKIDDETLLVSGEEAKIGEPKNELNYNPKAKGVITGFKYCRNCGNKLPQDACFCDKCGNKLDY